MFWYVKLQLWKTITILVFHFHINVTANMQNDIRWVLIIIFFEILIPPEPFMRDAPHFFYRKYNKNLL